MTQIVLMLYEDPKADPLSENRFHVEMHFCPGAKTIDDPEFLARSSPTRKRSVEDMRLLASNENSVNLVDAGNTSKTSKTDEINAPKSSQHGEGVSNSTDTIHPGLKSSSSYVVTTDSNPAQTKESSQSFTNAGVVSSMVSAQNPDLVLPGEEPVSSEGNDFETVYAGNERPRCAIGIENYSDTALAASTGDSALSSGTSIEESSSEERVLTRVRSSLSESELQQSSLSNNELHRVREAEDKRSKSESDIRIAGSPSKGHRETSSINRIAEEDESEPRVKSPRRPKAHSVSGTPPTLYSTSSSSSDSHDDFSIHKFSQGKLI